jgi:hypothetical protein
MRPQLLSVRTADDRVAQDEDQGAPLVCRHPAEPEPPAGELLVIGQGAPAGVQRAQRCDVGDRDSELLAEMPQQHHGQHPKGVQRSPAHPHEADVQRQSQLHGGAAAALDDGTLRAAEREERLQLELAQFAGNLAQS